MKKILSIILVAVLAISLSNCKGFLDKEPTDSVVAENALATLEDAGVAVNGMYTLLKYYTVFGNYMIQMGDLRADLLVPSEGNYIVYSYDYDPSQNSYFSLWRNFYTTITRANAIIKNIDPLEVPASKPVFLSVYEFNHAVVVFPLLPSLEKPVDFCPDGTFDNVLLCA